MGKNNSILPLFTTRFHIVDNYKRKNNKKVALYHSYTNKTRRLRQK